MKSSLITSILLLAGALSAQTYIDIPWREGSVFKDGSELHGMLRLGGDLGAPWLNHTKVYFVTMEDFGDKGHPKNKAIVEYTPEDIQAYSTYTEDKDGNRIDMNFVTDAPLLVKGLSKKNIKVFLQLKEKGAVNIYLYIPEPDHYTVESDEQRYQENQKALAQSTNYFKKGDGELFSAAECELSTYLSECPDVVSKIKSGAYGFADLSERPKKKGLGKVMADNAGDNPLEEKICHAVSDYNACVK